MLDLDNRILKNSVFILKFVDKYARGSVVSVVFYSKMSSVKIICFTVKIFTIKHLKFSFFIDLVSAKN